MTFNEFLEIQKQWERELAPFIKRALEDPNFPPISKSYELTRYALGKITPNDLRRYSRKEILWGTRFVWQVYKASLADGMSETRKEIPVLFA